MFRFLICDIVPIRVYFTLCNQIYKKNGIEYTKTIIKLLGILTTTK